MYPIRLETVETPKMSDAMKRVKSAVITAFLFIPAAHAETALEMQSYCRGVVAAEMLPNNRIRIPPDPDAHKCWGAFATIQEIIKSTETDGTVTFGVCAPANSSRMQLVKIFSKYVSDHPEQGHLGFTNVALIALLAVFPCRK
jgi:hypothetical protein